MKKSILFILLLSFLYQNTSSIWIITSFYINQDYIAKNVCINRFDAIPVCNGKCFLKEELSADAEKEQQIPNIKNKEVQPLFHETVNYNPVTTYIQTITQIDYPEYTPNFILSKLVFPVFQPPEFV